MFPKLSVDKISEIHNIINKSNKKDKPSLNMIIKGPLLWLKDLRVDQWIKPYIGLTQENLIENSVQDCLPYILKLHGPC